MLFHFLLDLRRRERTGISDADRASEADQVKAKLLEGKKGLIVGIANENSIAWGCAKAFRALGAELAVTYLNDKAKKYVEPLARELEAPIVMPLDVRERGQMEAVFERIGKDWGRLNFAVHSIAFSPKDALQGSNSRGSIGYVGSKPPEGDPAHHYHFEVFALDVAGPTEPGVDRETLLRTMQGHVLGRGEIIGLFQRAKR